MENKNVYIGQKGLFNRIYEEGMLDLLVYELQKLAEKEGNSAQFSVSRERSSMSVRIHN